VKERIAEVNKNAKAPFTIAKAVAFWGFSAARPRESASGGRGHRVDAARASGRRSAIGVGSRSRARISSRASRKDRAAACQAVRGVDERALAPESWRERCSPDFGGSSWPRSILGVE